MDTVKLDPARVSEIFLDCVSREEDAGETISSDGITQAPRFDAERLRSYEEEVVALLAELPDDFKQRGGRGGPFLGASYDKHGTQWTADQQAVEQLFLLGQGLGKAWYLLPKELWHMLPGQLPLIVVE